MRLTRSIIILPLLLLAGCSIRVSGTNQFYVAQTYLPLPEACRFSDMSEESDKRCGPTNVSGLAQAPDTIVGKCEAGPVMRHPSTAMERKSLSVLPGMTLGFLQSTYRSNAHGTLPVLTSWQWTVPTSEACRTGLQNIPTWQRSDLLVVRHLLSASTAKFQPSDTIGSDYFHRGILSACNTNNAQKSECVQKIMLNRFTRGLHLDIRQLRFSRDENTGFPPGVLADPQPGEIIQPPADIKDGQGMATWYADTWRLRSEDIFASINGTKCSAGVNDEVPCTFSYADLIWQTWSAGEQIPGLNTIPQFTVASAGDPLLAFRPMLDKWPLDASDGKPCAGTECKPEDRAARGFTELTVAIPITVGKAGTPLTVPVSTTVAGFEKQHGVSVRSIRRALVWLPIELVTTAKGNLTTAELADPDGRVTLLFQTPSPLSLEWHVLLLEGFAPDVLLAPGDIVELSEF